jgi:hypothetical protein
MKSPRQFIYQEPKPKKILTYKNYAKVRHGLESDEITAMNNKEEHRLENDYRRYRNKEMKLNRV